MADFPLCIWWKECERKRKWNYQSIVIRFNHSGVKKYPPNPSFWLCWIGRIRLTLKWWSTKNNPYRHQKDIKWINRTTDPLPNFQYMLFTKLTKHFPIKMDPCNQGNSYAQGATIIFPIIKCLKRTCSSVDLPGLEMFSYYWFPKKRKK